MSERKQIKVLPVMSALNSLSSISFISGGRLVREGRLTASFVCTPTKGE